MVLSMGKTRSSCNFILCAEFVLLMLLAVADIVATLETTDAFPVSTSAAHPNTSYRPQTSVRALQERQPDMNTSDPQDATGKQARSLNPILKYIPESNINDTVVMVSRDVNNPRVLLATQSWFIADFTAKDAGKPFNKRWSINVTFISSAQPSWYITTTTNNQFEMTERTKTFTTYVRLPDCANKDGWIIGNVLISRPYRVNYKISNWLALSRQLKRKHTEIAPHIREQIIDDAWSLAKASYIPLDIALSTIEYLDKEHEYLPWSAALKHLKYMEFALFNTSLHKTFEAFMKAKLQKPFEHFGPLSTTSLDEKIFARKLVAEQACHFGIDLCTSKARQLYLSWVKDPVKNQPPSNIVKAVACYAVANGGHIPWLFVLEQFKKSTNVSMKEAELSALTCTKTDWILTGFLDLMLRPHSVLRDQNCLGIITSFIQNSFLRQVAWDFYRYRYLEMKDRNIGLSCTEALPAITQLFNTHRELTQVIAFKRQNCSEFNENHFQNQVVAKIETNIRWLKTNTPIIRRWMAERGYLVH